MVNLARTDIDRLAQAFETLTRAGYVCRANFECCASCGAYAIDQLQSTNTVFWHEQSDEFAFGPSHDYDTDADLVQSQNLIDDLYLYWDGDGNTIVHALRDAGLTVEWNGSDAQAIVVKA